LNKKRTIYLIIAVFLILGGGFAYRKLNSSNQITIVSVDEQKDISQRNSDILKNENLVHISFDDVILSLENISENNYNSIFEDGFFSYIKSLHDQFGAVFSLYVFYENDDGTFNLSQVPDTFSNEFEENSHWLKLGFHSLNSDTNYQNSSMEQAKEDYELVIDELTRITGNEDSIDRVPRLHNYAASEESIKGFKQSELGIKGLLGPDDKRIAYDLNNADTSYLYTYDYFMKNNLSYFKTDFRLENVENISTITSDYFNNESPQKSNDLLTVFTHEYLLEDDPDLKNKLTKVIKASVDNDYVFGFPTDRL